MGYDSAGDGAYGCSLDGGGSNIPVWLQILLWIIYFVGVKMFMMEYINHFWAPFIVGSSMFVFIYLVYELLEKIWDDKEISDHE